jgi:two-component system response regulator YesN
MFKILIIDPNDHFRRSLKKILISRFAFVDIEEACNGKEGLLKVKTYQPHLIFLEIHLPAETGLDIARQIKAAHPDIIIVILTSYDFPEYQIAAEESGGAHLIPKDDWTGEDMIALVQSILSDLEIDERDDGAKKAPPPQVSELCKNDG